jgi:hypothetical protein
MAPTKLNKMAAVAIENGSDVIGACALMALTHVEQDGGHGN